MFLKKSDLDNFEKQKKVNIINSITGIKPANLIGTISPEGKTNLAIFSSVLHLGSNPAWIGFIMRPVNGFERHTYHNIIRTNFYTINHVPETYIAAAHQTSAKYEADISEFDACNVTPQFIDDFTAPFVKESIIKFGLKFMHEIHLPNDTLLIIGEVENIFTHDSCMDEMGNFDLSNSSIGISGTDTYYTLSKMIQLPYARP